MNALRITPWIAGSEAESAASRRAASRASTQGVINWKNFGKTWRMQPGAVRSIGDGFPDVTVFP
jgi:hypothetical protein